MVRPLTVKNSIHPRHSNVPWTQPRFKNTRRVIAAILLMVLLMAITMAGVVWTGLQSRINSRAMEIPVITGDNDIKPVTHDPIDPNDGRPLNVLVLGQDTRDGDEANAAIGGNDPSDKDNHQADTAMIVHISSDRQRIDVVSLPRDSIIDQPECATTNGIAPARYNVMLNSTFAYGWRQGGDLQSAVSCELATVNHVTGLDIMHTVVVDFAGMAKMIDAIDGVDICVPARVDDSYTGLKLDPGVHKLNGVDATQYARVRHGVDGADGSDLMRTVRQQTVVKALLKQALSNGTLSNPTRLYSLGVSVIDSLNLSSGLSSVPTLTGLAYSLRDLNMNNVQTQTVPVVPWSQDPNRVVWADDANKLWEAIKADEPLGEDPNTEDDESAGADAAVDNTQDSGVNGDQSTTDTPATDTTPSEETSSPASADAGRSDGFVMDDVTGLLKNPESGELKDPTTGGRVDPKTGYVYDPVTGGTVGLAYQYVDQTICKVK